MDIFSDAAQHVACLRNALGDVHDAGRLATAAATLSDERVLSVLTEATAVIATMEKIRTVASGVVASRSTRERGHGGLAQSEGHRTPVELVQKLTGMSRGGALKQVRVGESLLAAGDGDTDATAPTETRATDPDGSPHESGLPWHACLGRALLAGILVTDQHDAILRGLGEPPMASVSEGEGAADGGNTDASVDGATSFNDDARAAWAAAAEQLIEEAGSRTVEELLRAARSIRDRLDPIGAEERFAARHEARSFRLRTGDDGTTRGFFSFDDDGAAWMRTIIDSALRPRRGGPRFIDPTEKARAERLEADPRSNDQLAYDLLMDVMRAGALADAETVFGTRQAGVRVVTVIDPDNAAVIDSDNAAVTVGNGAPLPAAHLEEDGSSFPAWAAAQYRCGTGARECTIDHKGNPLYLGREQRTFSPRQKVALAVRDGGCRWNGCDRPASYCEAHHIDEWMADNGRTDIDRGILLCRFHHMQLHHHGWRITREELGEFILHPPGRTPAIALRPRAALRAAWAGIDPPPKRFLAA
ncbi:HNH endonuclease signature motif containing protein [Humibacter albus]|uniref:HNH endonuclease signature motif containing protein n=1 Tax=Humibacter albus TaxID=427754 RepID=UPI0003B47933|nr:HNH endonuclease signature motif containing protein [Humibacter albus]